MRSNGFIVSVFFATSVFAAAVQQTEPNDLSSYYGFGEMEVIKSDWGIQNLQIADFDGDGRNDIAFVNNVKAEIDLLIQKAQIGPGEPEVAVTAEDSDINAIVSETRFAKQVVPVSQRIFSFVCGDLNNDGLTDLAFYGEPKGLYVILQKAGEKKGKEGKVISWQTRKKIKIDDGLALIDALVCADLNNDSLEDLALAGRNAVYIISQKKDGTLSEPVKYPTTSQPQSISVGDLNGDKINDLVLITDDSEKCVSVRFGLRTGQLGPEQELFIERPKAWELHNLNGVHGDAMLTIDSRSGRLVCYRLADQKQHDADWPILYYPLVWGQENAKRDIVVSDINGDGLADVVVSNPGGAELIFYKQVLGLGLAEPVKFPALSSIDSLSAADIDGDKKTEVCSLSIKEKLIGISRFDNDRLTFPEPADINDEPLAAQLADIDGDKGADCVYISKDSNDVRSLRVLYSLKAGKDRFGGAASTALELKNLSVNPDGLKIADVDQDGLKDVLVFVKYELPILIRQTAKRKFEAVESRGTQMSLIKEAGLNSTAVANMNGKDGDEFLVAQGNFARSLIFSGGKNWNVIDQYNAKSTENSIMAVAAFNIFSKKGHPEILLLDGQKGQLQILKADENGTYRFEKELNVGTWSGATHLQMIYASLTGGKTKSILLFDSEKFAIITPPDGEKPENLETMFSYETKIKDGKYGNLTAGDINSDGRDDIVMVEYERNHIEILALDASGKCVPAMRFKVFEEKSYRDRREEKTSAEPHELKIADVTGDGKNDLVTLIHDRVIIYPQD